MDNLEVHAGSAAKCPAALITASPRSDPETAATTVGRAESPRRASRSPPTSSTLSVTQASHNSLSASRLMAWKYSARAPPTRSAEVHLARGYSATKRVNRYRHHDHFACPHN